MPRKKAYQQIFMEMIIFSDVPDHKSTELE